MVLEKREWIIISIITFILGILVGNYAFKSNSNNLINIEDQVTKIYVDIELVNKISWWYMKWKMETG